MIIPTPEFDARFADDGVPFRTKMIAWIQSEFADVLGKKTNLLKLPNGLEVLAEMYGTQNPKFEYRNPKQIRNSNIETRREAA